MHHNSRREGSPTARLIPMCGRFTLVKPEEIQATFHVDELPLNLSARYNIAPSQLVPIVYYDQGAEKTKCEMMKWGLVPSWSKEPSSKYSTINARMETLTSKPSFRRLVGSHTCIIPTNGYYEWHTEGKERYPLLIGFPDRHMFGLGGLWDEWHHNDTGEVLHTFTIITLPSSGPVAPIHSRMPAIVTPEHTEQWLHPRKWSAEELEVFLHNGAYNQLQPYRVTTAVNNPRTDAPGLIDPV
jgi:putative SOS response-associated peptidase YedK